MPIVGWRRVASASPCDFCAMLTSRGGVYSRERSADFEAHDGCTCSVEPVWEREPDPPEVVALREAWERVTAGRSGKDARAAWRRYWRERGKLVLGAQKRRQLAGLFDQRPARVVRVFGGSDNARVRLLSYRGIAELVVDKTYGRRVRDTAEQVRHQVNAEELGSLVFDAIGVRAPAAVGRDRRVLMEFVDGFDGYEVLAARGLSIVGDEMPDDILNTRDGRLMGLADALMVHSDRHPGNWKLTVDGRLAAVDQGEAFHHDFGEWSGVTAFNEYLIDGSEQLRRGVDMSWADLAAIRRRLEATRADFERLGRLDWHDGVMRRLAAIEEAAGEA